MKYKIYPIILLLTIAVPGIPLLLSRWLKNKVETDYFSYADSPLLSTLGNYDLLNWARVLLFLTAMAGVLITRYFQNKNPSLTGKIFLALQFSLALCMFAYYIIKYIYPLIYLMFNFLLS